MKETFYNNLRVALFETIPTDLVQKVMDVVTQQLGQYDLQLKPHEIVVYDNGDAEMLKRFFVAKATEGLTDNSLETYRRMLAMIFKKFSKHIKDISTDDIRLLMASMRVEKKSTAYQNFVRRILCSFFKWITQEGYIDKNPMLRIPSVREQKKIKKPLTEEELEQLRLNAGSLRNECIIEFLYSTGCRVSEMLSLDRDDVNLVENEVMVLGKGKKYRMVYLSPRCSALLKKYLSERKDNGEALFVADYSNWKNRNMDYRTGHRLDKCSVGELLRAIGKKCNIPNVHPHRFRRTTATLALKRGMKITDVQRMLGHSDIKTTTIYAISNDEEVKREHEKYLI